jgi:hypothetical protein
MIYLVFVVLIAILFVSRLMIGTRIERTRWFVDRSVRFAGGAAAWCCVVLLLRWAFGSTHAGWSAVAFGPIMFVVMSLFVLSALTIPVVWANTMREILNRLKSRD